MTTLGFAGEGVASTSEGTRRLHKGFGTVLALVLVLGLWLAPTDANAETTRFLDRTGNSLFVDRVAGTFVFASPALTIAISGQNPLIVNGRQFSLDATQNGYILRGIVNFPSRRATVSVIRESDLSFVVSMNSATTTVSPTPTNVPTPAFELRRAIGQGNLGGAPLRAFTMNVVTNVGEPISGLFTFRDPTIRIKMISEQLTTLDIQSDVVVMTGTANINGQSGIAFTATVYNRADALGHQNMTLMFATNPPVVVNDYLKAGRIRFTFRPRPVPTPTAEPTATYVGTRTPTRS